MLRPSFVEEVPSAVYSHEAISDATVTDGVLSAEQASSAGVSASAGQPSPPPSAEARSYATGPTHQWSRGPALAQSSASARSTAPAPKAKHGKQVAMDPDPIEARVTELLEFQKASSKMLIDRLDRFASSIEELAGKAFRQADHLNSFDSGHSRPYGHGMSYAFSQAHRRVPGHSFNLGSDAGYPSSCDDSDRNHGPHFESVYRRHCDSRSHSRSRSRSRGRSALDQRSGSRRWYRPADSEPSALSEIESQLHDSRGLAEQLRYRRTGPQPLAQAQADGGDVEDGVSEAVTWGGGAML